jgi:hypothetical protein
MSRSYDMQVEITGLDQSREEAVKKAAELEWPFDSWPPYDDKLLAYGEGQLCGGESEEEFVERLTRAIWTANGKFCPVEVRATYLDDLPHETYNLDEDQYDEFLSAADKSAETQEDHENHGR